MKKIEAETRIQIPFYDLDPMGVVWHGNYLKYTEIARANLMDKIGYSYLEMKEDNVVYPIAKMDLKYIKSAILNQKLILHAELTEYEPAIKVSYTFIDEDTNEIIFKANSMQICVDVNTNESIYIAPERLKKGVENA